MSKKFHEFLTCSDLPATKSYLRFSLNMTRCISCNIVTIIDSFSVKFIVRRIFLLKECTFFFKLELLLAILPHSGIEFELLFNFTQRILERNWTFENFWHFVLIIARREIQIVDVPSSAKWRKNKKFGANSWTSMTSY